MTTQHQLLLPKRSNPAVIGKKFGRLTILQIGRRPNSSSRQAYAVCDCDCGTKDHLTRLDGILSGATLGCGCVQIERTRKHGSWDHRQYQRWTNMMRRCYDPRNNRWADYGKRGIQVCKRWHDLNAFIADMDPTYVDGLELDRKDFDKDYFPDNCRWVTHTEQARNKRSVFRITIDGKTKTAAEWSREFGVSYGTVLERLNVLGWDPVRSVTTPARKYHPK